MKYRITPRGILIQNNKIIFASYQVKDKIVYALPGGKQEVGETLKDCLVREFKEELNLDIQVGKLALVKEFIRYSRKHTSDQLYTRTSLFITSN
jgi:8-oxo-dGTP diphosphatase